MRSLGATHRLAALVVALVWGITPVLAVFHSHDSGEVHRYCAEHRALEDVTEDGDPAPAPERDDAAFAQAETTPSHKGCAFGRFCRFGQVLSQFVLEATGVLEATPVQRPIVRVAAPAIAVILVAPKTSPPV